MRRKCWIASLTLAMTLLLVACSGYKTPTVSDPSKMSADTLCYRYAYARKDPAIADEVEARNLDCVAVLRAQGSMHDSPFHDDIDRARRVY